MQSHDGIKLQIEYDPITDTVTIEGMKYAGDLFRAFSESGMPKGRFFRVIDREDGALTIQQFEPPRSLPNEN